jgi:hypothetical protein
MSRYLPANRCTTMAKANGHASEAQPIAPTEASGAYTAWINQAMADGVKPEQALAFVGLGLMQRLGDPEGADFTTIASEAAEGCVDLQSLRQRLELTDLAIRTGAPLSTVEVAALLGARPGTPFVERGGVVARRISRNVWKLNRSSESSDRGYGDAFRRRL